MQKTEDYDDNHQLVTFDETVEMSTYLACFIVSDFTNTETSFENKGTSIPLKVYASPDNLDKTTYAGEVGKKAIEYYVNYFNIPYPLPKLGKWDSYKIYHETSKKKQKHSNQYVSILQIWWPFPISYPALWNTGAL